MMSGHVVAGLDVDRVARVASGAARRSFKLGSACVHVMPITAGWVLCAISNSAIEPRIILERLRRAGAVMALALVDGGSSGAPDGGAPSGSPASVALRGRRDN